MGQRARVQKNRSKVKGVAVKKRNTSAPDAKDVVLKKEKKKK